MKSAIAIYNSSPSLMRYKSRIRHRSPMRNIRQREESSPTLSRKVTVSRAIQFSTSMIAKKVKIRDAPRSAVSRSPFAPARTLESWKSQHGVAKRKKVFNISGNYPDIRDALLARDWYENKDEGSMLCDFKWTRKARVPVH